MNKRIVLQLFCMVLSCCVPDPGPGAREEFAVRLEISGPGSVTGSPVDTVVGRGDTLTLYAAADSGAVFTGWDAGRFFTGNPLVFPVMEASIVRAVFVKRPGDMVFIAACDSLFSMGADPATYTVEKPKHPVRFNYDFYFGAREVTVADYQLTANNDGAAAAHGDPQDSLPITNISWYDAVLYCNARSKSAGYDTVYTYTAKCAVTGACPYVLEKLAIRYDRFGYRLPTEAEWEYACRAGGTEEYIWGNGIAGADDYAWYFGNAENRLHAVGEKSPNKNGLYDMAGNAAEFVNDWLDYYSDSLYVNPVGPVHLTQAQFESSSWKRPLRGGSYRSSASFLRSGGRKGPYDMKFADAQIDIGFRVAMGAFAAPTVTSGIVIPDSLSAAVICKQSDLIASIGTHRVKAAFVYTAGRKHCCAYINFAAAPEAILRCGDDTTVSAPSISPDGKYIAWGSKDEGATAGSIITVRSLTDDFPVTARAPGFLPRWWVDPLSHDTFLVYTSGASLDDQPQWRNEKTLRMRIVAGKLQGDETVLCDSGSYHGGMSSDGRFLGTAYPTAKLIDLQLNDANIYYFVPPWNGMADQTDTPQVCNLSMSPSPAEPGEALFLDFGYPKVSTLLGKSYGFHAVIFIANPRLFSNDHVSGWFEVPRGYDLWDFTEWSNYSGAAVALAKTAVEGDEDAVVMINRNDSLYCTLVKGINLRDVALWIDPADVSEKFDPYRYFGKYNLPIRTQGQETLAKKLRLFWHERKRVSCVAVGNSPTLYGFEPNSVTSLATLNIAWYQGSIGGSITVAQQYVLPHTPQLKAIVLDLDASYFSVDCRTTNPRLTGLYDSKGYELDSSNNFYRSGLPQAVVEKITAFDTTSWSGFDQSGAFIDSLTGDGWGSAEIEGTDYAIDNPVVQANIGLLGELIAAAASRKAVVLAVNYPQNPGYRETDMVGRAGPNRATYLQLVEVLNGLERRYDNFHFYDANNLGNHDYTDEEARDMNHLNPRGGRKLASRVDSLLQIYLK